MERLEIRAALFVPSQVIRASGCDTLMVRDGREIIRSIVEGVEFLQSRVGSVCPLATYRAMEKDVWWGIHNESR